MNYINVKGGKLVCKKTNETFEAVGGIIEAIREFENEVKGQKLKSIVIYFRNSEYSLSFDKNSWFSWGFFNSVKNVNISNIVEIKIKQSSNSKVTFCNIFQNNEIIRKGDFIPKPEKIEINGMKMSNWDIPGKYISDYITNRVGGNNDNA